jgi:cytochrome c biogenesis protein CcdA
VDWSLYFPLIAAAAIYGIVSIVAGVMSGRGNETRAERVRDYGFLILIASGVWVVILLLLALFDQPDDIGDMLTITIVIVVFFVILLLVLFGLSLLVGRLGRGTSRRRRVTTDEL